MRRRQVIVGMSGVGLVLAAGSAALAATYRLTAHTGMTTGSAAR